MLETKDIQIKVRVTPTEKEQILAYCEKHSINLSEFLRQAIYNQLSGNAIFWEKV